MYTFTYGSVRLFSLALNECWYVFPSHYAMLLNSVPIELPETPRSSTSAISPLPKRESSCSAFSFSVLVPFS